MRRADVYTLAGAALSVGAPIGLLAVRAAARGGFPGAGPWEDVAADWPTYAYVSVSTCLAFALFGRVLGRRADTLAVLSTRDPVTGLLNRIALDERLQVELERVGRYGAPLSLLMVDVDRLKAINDRHGHRAGDAALRHVAAAIGAGSRRTDAAGRWGGDEFLVVASGTPLEAAATLAERICEGVRAGAREVAVTVSIGVTESRGQQESPAAVLDRADRALYAAKGAGRDRVVALGREG